MLLFELWVNNALHILFPFLEFVLEFERGFAALEEVQLSARHTGDILEFLWQKRSDEIDRYPGDGDISAGGHINLGESVVEAAVRETREEIGAKITANELEFVTMRPFNKNRFAWVYLVDWTDRAEEFHFDDKEVSEVRWVEYDKMDEFRKEFAKAPLKRGNLTFEMLDVWLKEHGNLQAE